MSISAQERADGLAKLPFQRTDSVRRGVFSGFWHAFVEILGQRELLGLLVRRELKAKYKDSTLGFIWTLVRPLTMLLIYFVFIGQVLGAARGTPQFAIFVYAGLTIWGLYSEIMIAGTGSIITNASLIRKVYLPREIFPLAAAGSALVNFGIQFAILLLAVIVSGQFPLSWNLLYVPAAVITALTWGVALTILLSALNVYLRDIQYLVEVLMQLLFWASPVVYSWQRVVDATAAHQWLQQVYLLNPMTVVVLGFQKGIWKAGSVTSDLNGTKVPPQPWPADLDLRMLVVFLVGLVLLVVAQRVFARLEGNFAQEI
jgi:ABC-2 type transport system permease protein